MMRDVGDIIWYRRPVFPAARHMFAVWRDLSCFADTLNTGLLPGVFWIAQAVNDAVQRQRVGRHLDCRHDVYVDLGGVGDKFGHIRL